VHPPGFHGEIAFWGTLVAVIGAGSAAYLYLGERREVQALTAVFRPFYELSYGKFFIDQLYLVGIVFPAMLLAYVCYGIDRFVIDGAVNLVGALPAYAGRMMRLLQNGMVQFYALAMFLGVIVLIWGMLTYGS
jgi:NADH-quinone oxidoreductase subunit L